MKKRFLALFIVFIMLFAQMSVFANGTEQTSVLDGTDLTKTIDDLESIYSDSSLSELTVLREITELREAKVKHFRLSNGINKAVVYSHPVHYMDNDGNWIDIDNSLTLNGNEYFSNNKFEIKFANKSGSNRLLSIKDGDYKIDFTPLNTNNVDVVIDNPQNSNGRKFDDVKNLKKLVSKATYSNIYDEVDIEYILSGNNIKENIVVNSKQDGYVYSFELKLNKLTAELSNGSIILSDVDTEENLYVIPVPYMYDANGVVSSDVEYSLTQNTTWKYTFTVTANAEWINTDGRAFPVTIDPTIIANVADKDIFVMPDGNNDSFTHLIIGNYMDTYKDIPGFIKFTDVETIPEESVLVNAKVAMFLVGVENTSNIDFYIGVYEAVKNWVDDSEFTHDTVGDYYAGTPINSVQIVSDGTYEWNVTSLYKKWIENENSNHGLCVKAVNLPEDKNANVRITLAGNTSNYLAPQLELTYFDIIGVEDYYGYQNTMLDIIGKSYVNLYNGSLTYVNNLTTIDNQVLPYEINMVYNSIEKSWRPSFAESITMLDFDISNAASETETDSAIDNIYLWRDADGTTHSFAPYLQKNYWGAYVPYEESAVGDLWPVTAPVTFYPDDDIDYVLTKTTDGEFILKDYNGTQRLFDSSGRLSRICDAQGNVQYFSYVDDKLSLVDYKTFDNEFVTQVRLTYHANGNLKTIYNFATQLEISLDWSGTKITKIMYNYKDSPTHKEINFTYYRVSGILGRVTDSTDEIYIEYEKEESTDKIIKIMEFSKANDTYVLQRQNNVQYNIDNTVCTDLATDLTLNTDDVHEKYTFDERGRKFTLSLGSGSSTYFSLVSTYEYDDEILPDDIYYTISYSNSINNELYVDESEANIVRYDIGVGEEEFLNFANLPEISTTNSATSLNNHTIMDEFIGTTDNSLVTPTDTIGTDDRKLVENTSTSPYSAICYVRVFFDGAEDAPDRGTGFLIGPNILLTARHNLINEGSNQPFPEKILIYPGGHEDENAEITSPYEVVEVETCYLQREYYADGIINFDWGLCILESDIGYRTGWLDISVASENMLNREMCIIGFPSNLGRNMYSCIGTITLIEDLRFFYDADTAGGNSGSPVFLNDDNYVVIGIHTTGSSTRNGATRINSFIYNFAMSLKANE